MKKSLPNCSWSLSDVVKDQMALRNIKISTLTIQKWMSSQKKDACSVAIRDTAAAVPTEVLLWWNLETTTQGRKQFHQMSHRKWARCLHMTKGDEERRWGAHFSYCSSCLCITFFYYSFGHLRCFPSGYIFFFIPAIQCSLSFSLFHLPSDTLPYPQLNSIPGVFLLRNIHATLGVMGMQPLQRSRWHPLATSRLFGTRRDVATISSIFGCKRAEARFSTAHLFMPKPAVGVQIHFDAREGTDFTGLWRSISTPSVCTKRQR